MTHFPIIKKWWGFFNIASNGDSNTLWAIFLARVISYLSNKLGVIRQNVHNTLIFHNMPMLDNLLQFNRKKWMMKKWKRWWKVQYKVKWPYGYWNTKARTPYFYYSFTFFFMLWFLNWRWKLLGLQIDSDTQF